MDKTIHINAKAIKATKITIRVLDTHDTVRATLFWELSKATVRSKELLKIEVADEDLINVYCTRDSTKNIDVWLRHMGFCHIRMVGYKDVVTLITEQPQEEISKELVFVKK